MGMAASQARYLALVARKSNCEYEGQQINQSRLNLSNQTANLFNQMLGLSVPVPPSTQDFTKLQYSFTDGINGSVIDKWEQLATPDDQGNNYVVEYHYEANVYKGFQKKMNDPQIQFSNTIVPMDLKNDRVAQSNARTKIYKAQKEVTAKQEAYNKALADYQAAQTKGATLVEYRDSSFTDINNASYSAANNCYTVTKDANNTYYTAYTKLLDGFTEEQYKASIADTDPADLKSAKKAYQAVTAWKENGMKIDDDKIYFTTTSDTSKILTDNPYIALRSDLQSLTGLGYDTLTTLPQYKVGTQGTAETEEPYSIYGMQTMINAKHTTALEAQDALKIAEKDLELLNMPSYVGNSKLTSLSELTQEQLAEIKQIMRTMDEQGVDTSNFYNCFEDSLNIAENNYIGGIYSFERDGVTYYTTFYDLVDTAVDSDFMNDIDNQPKLNYYHANYVKDNVYTTDKAVLDTDSQGRFKTVRFASDGAQYTLTVEQITDDVAYQDAMNKYTYEAAEYDKMIQDINAKTSLIHQQDQQLELKLKQLDTEQNALSNEIDAVSKVVKDNVEKSFKTFGG